MKILEKYKNIVIASWSIHVIAEFSAEKKYITSKTKSLKQAQETSEIYGKLGLQMYATGATAVPRRLPTSYSKCFCYFAHKFHSRADLESARIVAHPLRA